MRCPVDDEELEILPNVPGLAESCQACGGLWLEATSLRQLQATLPSAPLAAHPRDPRRCSRCEVAMGRMSLPEVEVDLCPDCQGVWLDRGELDTLRQLRQQRLDGRQDRALAGGAKGGPDLEVSGRQVVLSGIDAANVVELVFDLAGIVFDIFG